MSDDTCLRCFSRRARRRIAPSTWIVYGLGISQLDQTDITIF